MVWKLWRWPLWAALTLIGAFLSIDLGFFIANLYKVVDGGWVPLLLGTAMFVVMWTWTRGSAILTGPDPPRFDPDAGPDQDAREIEAGPGSRNRGLPHQRSDSAPSSLMHNLKHNKVLHERVVLLNVRTETTPRVAAAQAVTR